MLGTLFLILVLSLIVLDVVLFSFEQYEWSVGIMIASIAAAYFFQPDFNEFVKTGWYLILTHYVPTYLVLGFVVAVVKWVIYNFKTADRIRNVKQEFDAKNTALVDPTPESLADRRKAFVSFFKDNLSYNSRLKVYSADYTKPTAVVDALTPRAKDNVGPITVWILQWPVVVVSTLFSDLIVKIGKHAARLFDMLFSVVSRALVAKATKGL